MRVSAENVQLIYVRQNNFIGRDGKGVSFIKFRIADDEGNAFEGATNESVLSAYGGKEKIKGVASVEFFQAVSKDGKAYLKMRLLGFTATK